MQRPERVSSRWLAACVLVMAIAGFAYAGVGSVVKYREIFASPVGASPSASIDEQLAPAGMSASDLRGAARQGRFAGGRVVVRAADPETTREELYQVYYSAGYLLYPTAVRIVRQPLTTARAPHGPRVVIVGDSTLEARK